MFTDLPRISLAHLPTPLEALPRLSQALGGPRLWIKRDDQTGLAGGGNKTRKLEFVLAEALRQECDSLVTVGAAQSNHCRQTAAAAAKLGLRCVLVLGGRPPQEISGNLLLDHLLGAEIVWCGDRPREAVLDEVVAAERAHGRSPAAIPLGASVPLGAAGYALAMVELKEQMDAAGLRFDRIVFASSSGGTQAGMLVGARLAGLSAELLGISIDHGRPALQEHVAALATATAGRLGLAYTFAAGDVAVNADYLGAGYGVLGAPEREAIRLFALEEGILLDPVYTGRAAAGLVDLIRRGVLPRDEAVLFWHTGGTPALWAYAGELGG
jgi:D-cysteine desulfhydrase family pyridoxal phosphate-dependent enzyme